MKLKAGGGGEKHEWQIQTTKGAYDYSAGCLEFMDGEEFGREDLSEIEEAHYDTTNDCFNKNAMILYDARKAEKTAEADKCFYAEASDEFSCDLSRFTDEGERDDFINSVNNAENDATAQALSTETAMESHKDQFSYWNN